MSHRYKDLAPQAILVLLVIVAVALKWSVQAEEQSTDRAAPDRTLQSR